MLRINLSTRPFYNIRAVHGALVLGAAVVIALTLFNVIQIVRLSASHYRLGAGAAAAEAEAARLRGEAAKIRGQINPQELQVVSNAAREANAIIDQRTFSWTDLFAQFEDTLPPNVRITAVQPRLEPQGAFMVGVGVESRGSEDLDAFIEALEATGAFRDVLSTQEQTRDGLIQAVVEGRYEPSARPADTPAAEGAAP